MFAAVIAAAVVYLSPSTEADVPSTTSLRVIAAEELAPLLASNVKPTELALATLIVVLIASISVIGLPLKESTVP